jgi:hypothetical protein
LCVDFMVRIEERIKVGCFGGYRGILHFELQGWMCVNDCDRSNELCK